MGTGPPHRGGSAPPVCSASPRQIRAQAGGIRVPGTHRSVEMGRRMAGAWSRPCSTRGRCGPFVERLRFPLPDPHGPTVAGRGTPDNPSGLSGRCRSPPRDGRADRDAVSRNAARSGSVERAPENTGVARNRARADFEAALPAPAGSRVLPESPPGPQRGRRPPPGPSGCRLEVGPISPAGVSRPPAATTGTGRRYIPWGVVQPNVPASGNSGALLP